MIPPKVTVIIPTFRDGESLWQCVEALARQTYDAQATEILCVDNTPEFALRDKADSLAPAKLLHEPRPGSYAARNRGLFEATGEIFAFTDADCLPDPGWIEAGVAALREYPGGALVVGGIKVFPKDAARPNAVELIEALMAFPQERYASVYKFGATANLFVPRRVIEQAGPFHDSVASGGDREFGQRVHGRGFPVVFCEAASVRHPARSKLTDLLTKTRRVVSGVYDLERDGRAAKGSFLRGLLKDLRPPVQTCWNLLKPSSPGSLARRFSAASTFCFLRYYRAAYRVRVLFGARKLR